MVEKIGSCCFLNKLNPSSGFQPHRYSYFQMQLVPPVLGLWGILRCKSDFLPAFPIFLGLLSHYHSSKCFSASKMSLFLFFSLFSFFFFVCLFNALLDTLVEFWREWRQICVYNQQSLTGSSLGMRFFLKKKQN